MKISGTKLPAKDPMVVTAWNAMAKSGASDDAKAFGLRMAETIAQNCAADSEMIAAMLVHTCVDAGDAAKILPPRAAKIVEILQSGDDRYRHLGDPANDALPMASDIRIAMLASGIVRLNRWDAEVQVLMDNPELAKLGAAFAKANGEDASDFENPLKYAQESLAEIHADAGPLLGRTGVPALEKCYVEAYNHFAGTAGVPPLAAMDRASPPAPKGP